PKSGSGAPAPRITYDPLPTLTLPETVCTSTRPAESPMCARRECLFCSSRITGILVRMSPEVDSAESRKLALEGTRIATDPEIVFNSHNRLALGFPETWMDPEIACTFTSLLAPSTSIEPLAADASTRSPGRCTRMDPEAALTFTSPLTSAILISPDALETRKKPPTEDTSMEPLAAFT